MTNCTCDSSSCPEGAAGAVLAFAHLGFGGDGCGAPTPNEIKCVISNGCDYAAAGCLDNTCY